MKRIPDEFVFTRNCQFRFEVSSVHRDNVSEDLNSLKVNTSHQWRSKGYCRPGPNIYIYGRPYWYSRNTFASEIAAPVKVRPPHPHPLCSATAFHPPVLYGLHNVCFLFKLSEVISFRHTVCECNFRTILL